MKTRDRILSVAADLFLEHGYDGTGIEQIITIAKTSKGGLYHHFKDKFQLYQSVLEQLFLVPMQAIDFDQFTNMPHSQQHKMMIGYFQTLPDILPAMSKHGIAKYYSLYFDSISRSKTFKTAIRGYYQQLLTAMQTAIIKKNDISSKLAAQQSRAFLASLEGEIYLCSILGDSPTYSTLTKKA